MPIPLRSRLSRSSATLRTIVLGWAVLLTVPLTLLIARHSVALPTNRLTDVALPATGSWQAVHILAPDCGCSRLVLQHLVRRGVQEGLDETVFILGPQPGWRERLVAAGYRVTQVDPEEVARDRGIQGAPWLLLIRADGTVAYSGGYSPNPVHSESDLQDLALWQSARAGAALTPHPAFGCATSTALRAAFDPATHFRRVIDAAAPKLP